MASGHVAIGLAARRWYERDQSPPWAPLTSMVVWSSISLMPDADVYGFALGMPYALDALTDGGRMCAAVAL
jgi:hypothetical protein